MNGPPTDASGRYCAACEAAVVEELTSAGLAFAREYPDAPRAKPELVTA